MHLKKLNNSIHMQTGVELNSVHVHITRCQQGQQATIILHMHMNKMSVQTVVSSLQQIMHVLILVQFRAPPAKPYITYTL